MNTFTLTSGETTQVVTKNEIKGARWNYFKIEASTADWALTVSSDVKGDLYVRKGAQELPDPANFDTVIKG